MIQIHRWMDNKNNNNKIKAIIHISIQLIKITLIVIMNNIMMVNGARISYK